MFNAEARNHRSRSAKLISANVLEEMTRWPGPDLTFSWACLRKRDGHLRRQGSSSSQALSSSLYDRSLVKSDGHSLSTRVHPDLIVQQRSLSYSLPSIHRAARPTQTQVPLSKLAHKKKPHSSIQEDKMRRANKSPALVHAIAALMLLLPPEARAGLPSTTASTLLLLP